MRSWGPARARTTEMMNLTPRKEGTRALSTGYLFSWGVLLFLNILRAQHLGASFTCLVNSIGSIGNKRQSSKIVAPAPRSLAFLQMELMGESCQDSLLRVENGT